MKLKQIRPKDLVRALIKGGFVIKRQKGSHIFLESAMGSEKRVTSVSLHSGTLPKGTLGAIIKQAGIDENKLLELLK